MTSNSWDREGLLLIMILLVLLFTLMDKQDEQAFNPSSSLFDWEGSRVDGS